jgi:hypothetical protein
MLSLFRQRADLQEEAKKRWLERLARLKGGQT